MVSDSRLEELHRFAKDIGLKIEWFQNKIGKQHHDLTTERMKAKAIKNGAVMVGTKELIKRMIRTIK